MSGLRISELFSLRPFACATRIIIALRELLGIENLVQKGKPYHRLEVKKGLAQSCFLV